MAKSSFWDDLGNTLTRKAKGLSSRAENLYEIQKIRNKLSAQERMTEKLMMDIGKMIYTRYEQGEAVDGETGVICEEISQHMLEADHYRDAIAASKGEKFCPACHKAVMREASFCPYCGAACPTAELEEKAADVIEQADEELEEAAEAEVTEVPETEAEENAEATEVVADPEETVEASEVVETAETAEASETETSGSDPELEEERTEVGSAETEGPAADPENTETTELNGDGANTLRAFLTGKVIPLKEVNDGVFSEGVMGDGRAILPENDTLYAPCDGEVTVLMDESRHACGLTLENGMEILLHIGIDTVEMQGDGFEYLVSLNQKVKQGTPLVRFDREKIRTAGHPDVTVCIVTEEGNAKDFEFVTDIHAEAGKTEIVLFN